MPTIRVRAFCMQTNERLTSLMRLELILGILYEYRKTSMTG